MRVSSRHTCLLLSGASALAMCLAAPVAQAQEAPETSRTFDTILVTTEKREASIQDVPIAVSAFDESMLDKMNLDGGPNLVLSIPNANFSKGNFTGANFSLRGVGTKLVSATADNAVGVHVNGAPLTANRLFEAEFYDTERIEVLRGPQGTLYGRNATGGVINQITAKPTDVFEGKVDFTYGSENTIKVRGFVNLPVGDTAALRVAAYYHTRDGYIENAVTGNDVDSRDLNSFRVTFASDLGERADFYIMYERFEEDDSRIRASKQICSKAPTPTNIGGVPINNALTAGLLQQGCLPTPIAQKTGTVNSSATLGGLLGNLTGLVSGDAFAGVSAGGLRTTAAAFDPVYRAEQSLVQAGLNVDITDSLTLSFLTQYSDQSVFSNEDYSKVTPNGTFNNIPAAPFNLLFPGGTVNDPQLGASNVFRTFDLSRGDSTEFSQEIRLQSDFEGPLNFTVGGIYLNFETVTDYYVFSNTLTANAQLQNFFASLPPGAIPGTPTGPGVAVPIDAGNGASTIGANVNNTGRNYFLSRTPYELDAYALFGEVYYNFTDDFKITAGLRYTSDDKSVINNSTALLANVGTLPLALTEPNNAFLTDPVNPTASTQFEEVTGRFGFDCKTALPFTDESLIYGSYAQGYKGGGINPPPAVGVAPIQPTYEPEFVNAFEVGMKNVMMGGAMQLNLTAFTYDYQGYQVSKIVNRTSLNENIDAEIQGLEIEAIWSPIEGLVFNSNIGLLNTEITSGSSVDAADRTQGDPSRIVIKASDASNCVVPVAGLAQIVGLINAGALPANAVLGLCSGAFSSANPANPLAGFGIAVNPTEGTSVDLAGKELPNAPEMTFSLGAEYTWNMTPNWEVTARGDYYRQTESWSRIYNAVNDKLDSWENVNLSLTLNNESKGIYVELYVKNLLDDDVITDAYLTDDSSGLFTNVYLTDPRIMGITIGKRF
jgi:outer membrane receptor protein involved in Fe transport